MSQRRVAANVLIAFVVASLFAVPVLTASFSAPAPPIGSPHDTDRFEVLREREPAATDPSETPGDRATSERERLADGLAAIRADEVHRRGITGEGVRVGVIGSAFDRTHSDIADSVADHESVARDDVVRRTGAHDTAVAEVVSRTAPGSDLYLVGIGANPSSQEYVRAIEWLLENEVDVIVDSGSYYPSTDGSDYRITAAAERASDRGVVFVTSAGNNGDRHWRGRADGDSWVAFGDGVEGNALDGGDRIAGRVSLRLSWADDADYDLYLYRSVEGDHRVVARSARRQTDGADPVEEIDVRVPEGSYHVAVHAHDGDDETELRLFSTYQSLTYATADGSMVAPATSERVIAVGAIDPERGSYRAYSSRGDAVLGAPDGVATEAAGEFYGTSAAAPYVAGTAALIEARAPELTPRQVEHLLRETAQGDDVSRVDTLAAVEAATAENGVAGDDADLASNSANATNATATGSADPTFSVADGNATNATAGADRTADAAETNATSSDRDGTASATPSIDPGSYTADRAAVREDELGEPLAVPGRSC